tara:strand:+ start:276 stop:455 length:180 start_codon:yes stop_codon:yes gene_type:complete
MISIVEDKCDFCGSCVAVCPPDCIELKEASIKIIHEECIDCNLCILICPIDVLYEENKR